jgi:hypothetical protein
MAGMLRGLWSLALLYQLLYDDLLADASSPFSWDKVAEATTGSGRQDLARAAQSAARRHWSRLGESRDRAGIAAAIAMLLWRVAVLTRRSPPARCGSRGRFRRAG